MNVPDCVRGLEIRSTRKVRFWPLVGIASFLVLAVVNVTAPLWLPPAWLARHRLMDLTGLGLWGAPIAYLAISFVSYGFHRLEHRYDVLWRGLHQMHHVAQRVDMAGWALGHPLETVIQTAIITGVATLVLGVDPLAAALAGTVGTIITMFVHLNIPTPAWIGYVILRPEQHCLHHERDVHARNYGNDLAIWDQLFGSFQNVAAFKGEAGFGRPAIGLLPAVLAFADVDGSRSERQ